MWGACRIDISSTSCHVLEEAEEIENFFTNPTYPPRSAKRRLTQALEAVRTSTTRLERDRKAVSHFLEGF